MAPLEAIFIWAAIVCYGIAGGLYVYAFIFGKERLIARLTFVVCCAFALHTAGILARYSAIGNLPWASEYETTVAGSWFVTLFTIIIFFRYRGFRGIGVATVPFSLLLLGFGTMRTPQLVPMAAALKSFWLGIHVFFAWLAFGSFSIASGMGVIYILRVRRPGREFYKKLPEPSRMDDLMLKYVVFGFITDAVMVASGAIWAKDLWGNYWSWDPVETWSLLAWLIYGLAIHLRLTRGWRGEKFAWVVIFALFGMIISFFGVNFFITSSLHFFGAMQPVK